MDFLALIIAGSIVGAGIIYVIGQGFDRLIQVVARNGDSIAREINHLSDTHREKINHLSNAVRLTAKKEKEEG